MKVKRSASNPILKPNKEQSWEAEAVFNGCPAKKGKSTYLLYRALSLPHYHTLVNAKMMLSDIGIAKSKNGIDFEDRQRFIVPEHHWERFGCEDPRVTKLDGKYYIFYTALSSYPFGAEGIKIGLAISQNLKTVEKKHLITPFNAKAMALFPEKINNRYWAVLTVHTDRPPAKICLASFNKEEDLWSKKHWEAWYQNFDQFSLPLLRQPQDHLEVGSPPLKTERGWLLIYSYIQNYFSSQKLFTVEAALLDLENPQSIIGRTSVPILTPEKYYEKNGLVPDVIFPSGALIEGSRLNIYYGAADTTCCLATLRLSSLLDQMTKKKEKKIGLKRAKENPILKPLKNNSWEAKAVFNPAALYLEGRVHLLYRAMSEDNTSVLGYASSKDGINIDYRSPKPVYLPKEPFEQKLVSGGNSGCEDPRLTRIKDKIYLTYTAFDGRNPARVALSSIKIKNFLSQCWRWTKPVLISPPGFDDKDAFIFPEKIRGDFAVVHRSGDDIDLGFTPALKFKKGEWLGEYRWIAPRRGWWDSKKVGAAAPPVKTKSGWVFLYHGVSEDKIYRVGAVLLDLANPIKIIGRTIEPIFEPEENYEKEGQVANVVFPCGNVVLEDKLYVYYGGADQVIGVATTRIKKLVSLLERF